MQFQKLSISLFEMPACPASAHIDLVDEGVSFDHADFDFRHGDLGYCGVTLIVENWVYIYILSEL